MSAPMDDDRPATLEEQAATALEISEAFGAIIAELLARHNATSERLDTIERKLPKVLPGETRSDFRFEDYPPAETEAEKNKQLEQVRAAWERLHGWVDWLVATYRLTSVIPACWPEHPTIVEELIGLRVSWVGAWLDASSHDAIAAWHERLSKARARLADGNWGKPRCDGEHDDSGIDLVEQYRAWARHRTRNAALIAARDRSLRQAAAASQDATGGPGTSPAQAPVAAVNGGER